MTEEEERQLDARIEHYWDVRADGYNRMRQHHLHGPEFEFWRSELSGNLPSSDRPLKILDIGTGTGFLAIIAASLGHRITGIDLSKAILKKASDSASEFDFCDHLEFRRENAKDLPWKDNYFDAVLSRNTIWTVTDAAKIFSELFRVLKPGGILLMYDSDYGKASFADPAVKDRDFLNLLIECDSYKSLLPISKVRRPAWDIMALRNTGFVHCECRKNISYKLNAHGANHAVSSATFAIYAVKPAKPDYLPNDHGFDLFNHHNQLFYREMHQFGDRQDTEYLIMDLLCRQPEGLRSSDIMEHYYIPKQTLTRMIAQLTKTGLIEPRKNPRDSRSMLLYSTLKGRNYHREQTMRRYEIYADVLQNFPVGKLEQLNELYMEFMNAAWNEKDG